MSTLERLGIAKRSVVLDVGFRTLDELVAISRLVGEEGVVYGIEPDKSLVAEASQQAAQTRNIRPMMGHASKIPLPDESVDTVLFKGTMHHIDKPLEALREARRVCRKSGRIVIVDFMPFPSRWLRRANLKWRFRHPTKLHTPPPDKHPGFREEDLRNYMQSLDLSVELRAEFCRGASLGS